MGARNTKLPDGWVESIIGEIVEIYDSKRIPLNSKQRALKKGEFPYYGANGQIDSIDDFIFEGEFVLLAEDGGYFNDPFRPVAYCVNGKFWANNHVHILKTLGMMPHGFLLHYLNSYDLMPFVSGTTRLKLNQASMRRIPITFPPLNEQKRIVAKIEELQARSSRAREALETIPDLLEQFRQSILAAAFRGDLTKVWRKKQGKKLEPASELLERIRIERRNRWEEAELTKLKAKGLTGEKLDEVFAKQRKKYKEPAPVDTSGLPDLPKGWCWATLADLALIKGGLTKGKKRKKGEKLHQVHYLRVANVQRGYLNLDEILKIEATEVELKDLNLQKGDILLNEGGDLDKLGRGWVWNLEIKRCIHQNHVFRARLVDLSSCIPELISTYINEFGQNYFLRKGKQTTNLASVSLTSISKIPVPLFTKNEAEILWEEINKNKSIFNKIELAKSNAENKIDELNQSILAKAFRGELVSQDPNDEPASILLERIRQEKAHQAEAQKTKPMQKGKKMKRQKSN